MDNWIKCQQECQKCEQNVFLHLMLIKQSYLLDKKVIFRWLCFPQVVQKHTLSEVGTKWHLMAGCVKNIRTKNYQSLMIGFQVTVKNVGMLFFETQCSSMI